MTKTTYKRKHLIWGLTEFQMMSPGLPWWGAVQQAGRQAGSVPAQ